MSYLDTVQEKKQAAAMRNKELTDLSAMVAELKKMQLAALMGGKDKSTVILTDQTDLGDKLREMNDKLVAAIQGIDPTEMSQHHLLAFKQLQRDVQAVAAAVKAAKPDQSAVIQAIKGLKLDPVINLPEPRVTVQAAGVDLSPLQDTIREVMGPRDSSTEPDRFDLSRYRAMDIKEGEQVQYVGFMNPEGAWYIIENDLRNDTMRFVFGRTYYARHFKNAASFQYQLLNKAIQSATT